MVCLFVRSVIPLTASQEQPPPNALGDRVDLNTPNTTEVTENPGLETGCMNWLFI